MMRTALVALAAMVVSCKRNTTDAALPDALNLAPSASVSAIAVPPKRDANDLNVDDAGGAAYEGQDADDSGIRSWRAVRVLSEYADNPVRADATFGKRTIAVLGRVQSIEQVGDETVVDVGGEDKTLLHLACHVVKDEHNVGGVKESVIALNRRDVALLMGEIQGKRGLEVTMTGCVISSLRTIVGDGGR